MTRFRTIACPLALSIGVVSAPALAVEEETSDDATHSEEDKAASESQTLAVPDSFQGEPDPLSNVFEVVFDETWATVGIGAGLVPSYSGSDDYRAFPLPLIVGRVAGVGISPNGPGFNLNVLSEGAQAQRGRAPSKASFSFGPSFRLRNDRADNINDPVVELAGELDTALEVGVNGGVSFPGVFAQGDRLGVSTQVRWDILGAYSGMVVDPSISYFRPIGRGAALQTGISASFIDDDFADYYYSVSPAQSAASGLPQFTADGGLNSVGANAILTVDLDNNLLNGGFNVYGIAGYSRLVGDAADTPYTSIRGSADQYLAGVGIAYTF